MLPIQLMCNTSDDELKANIRANDKLTKETAAELVALNTGRESMGCPYEPPPSKPKKVTS